VEKRLPLVTKMNINLKFIIMTKYKVIFKSILVTDNESITKMQQTINLWITNGKLKKYKTSVVGEHIFFELCVHKAE
jgi:hypothetical protein